MAKRQAKKNQAAPPAPPVDEAPPVEEEFAPSVTREFDVEIHPGIQRMESNTLVRREDALGEVEVKQQAMAESAIEAQIRADVEAGFILALRHSRSIDQARAEILKECKRPSFAATAIYSKPVGKKQDDDGKWVQNYVEGLSIRFAEAAMRYYRNMKTYSMVVHDGPKRRLTAVNVIDLEGNNSHGKMLITEKTVERKSLRKGQTALRARLNSYGDTVYLVEATEDDVAVKEAAGISKAIRTGILRLLPGDIQDEAKIQIYATLKDRAAQDPDGERKAIADAFASQGIFPEALAKYLGHDLGTTTPSEIVQLRIVYNTLKSGEANWAEIMTARQGDESPVSANGGSKGNEALKAKLRSVGQASQSPAAAPVRPAKPAEPPADTPARPRVAAEPPSQELFRTQKLTGPDPVVEARASLRKTLVDDFGYQAALVDPKLAEMTTMEQLAEYRQKAEKAHAAQIGEKKS